MVNEGARARKLILWVVLGLAVLVLGVAAAVALPILTHQSAGGSGQEVPDRYVSEATAEGADGRTRTLSVWNSDGEAADLSQVVAGDVLSVRGSGFDASIGIYVAICAVPERADERPSPCLGGIPEGAEEGDAEQRALSSAWVTDAWAWRAFATDRWSDPGSGSFSVELAVPEPTGEGLDCRVSRCAIATRADHTAGSDRVQDMLLPVAFAE